MKHRHLIVINEQLYTNTTNHSKTAMQTNQTISSTPDTSQLPAFLGPTLSITGNICISLGFQLQKLSNAQTSPHMLTIRLGLALMTLGELSNFAAYGMASVSLVTGLDVVAVASNVVLHRVFFDERMSRSGVMGVMMAVMGVVVMVMNAPQAERDDYAYVYESLQSWTALGYMGGLWVISLWVANPMDLISIGISKASRRSYPIYHCFLSGLMGTFTIIGAKGVSSALRHAITNNSSTVFTAPSVCWLTYILITTTIASVALQMVYLSLAFERFGSSTVVCAYFPIFTILAFSASTIVFRETVFPHYAVLFIIGLLLAFAGVFAISSDDCGECTMVAHSPETDQQRLVRVVVVRGEGKVEE
jgi:uncharacterized membrane protein